MQELLGKRIERILVASDQSVLVFITDQGEVIYETYADCCSETWFADITGVDGLLGAVVESAQDILMPENDFDARQDDRCRQEYDQFYGVQIVTAKGYCDIIYRNSSNGYYGGDIMYREDLPSHIDRSELREITEDWSA